MEHHLKHFRYVMGENPVTVFAFSLFSLILFLALFGPWIAPYDPLATDAANVLQPPSWRHICGTDQLGRDVFSRVIAATRLDLGIAISAVTLSFVFGCALGCSAGFWGGWTDRIVGRFSDTIMAFPLFAVFLRFERRLLDGARLRLQQRQRRPVLRLERIHFHHHRRRL